MIDLGAVERSQHDDRTIMLLAPWESELLNGRFIDQSAGESGAAATAVSDVGTALSDFIVEVLDVMMKLGVGATGPVMTSGKRSVVVTGGGRGNYRVVRAVMVDPVLPEWRGTGSRINESRAVDDQWHRTAFRVNRQASALGVLTVGLEMLHACGSG